MRVIETLPSGQQIVEIDEDDELEELAFYEMVTGKGPITIMHAGPRSDQHSGSPSAPPTEQPPTGSPPPEPEGASRS